MPLPKPSQPGWPSQLSLSRSQGAQKAESGDKAAGQTLEGSEECPHPCCEEVLPSLRLLQVPSGTFPLCLGGRDISGCGDSSSCGFAKVCELGLVFPASQVLQDRCPEDSGMLKTPFRTLCLVRPRKDPDTAARAELSSLGGSLSRFFSISKQNGKVLRKMLLRDLGLKPCTNLREYPQGILYPGSSWPSPIEQESSPG